MPNVEEWGDKYLIGIEQLDEHHQHLFELLHESYHMMVSKKCKNSEIERILDSMSDYATYHITTEEDWMRSLNYPKQDQHFIEHEKFINRVSDFNNEFKKGSDHLTLEIISFLRGWFLNHILTDDKDFGTFIKEGTKFCEVKTAKA